jgi:hypothetical protein
LFFYELHEGDDEVYSDVLVVSESEWEPDEFFELVQTIRRRIQNQYHHDTLSEAIATELERDHGFVHVTDDRLAAAVNVSVVEEENFLSELEVELADAEEDDDDDDDDDDEEDDEDHDDDEEDEDPRADFKSVLVDFDPDGRLN